jgi:2-succinyl-6-hydroxy-2,4-cyclohexadiene-1-carboxylate synthase
MTAKTPQARALSAQHAAGAPLLGLEAPGQNLSGVVLTGAALKAANFAGSVLREADLRGADLRRADLRGAVLAGADLRGADLRGAQANGALLTGADLREADLRDARFDGASLQGCQLHDAQLEGASLVRADLRGVPRDRLQGADTAGALLDSRVTEAAGPDARARTFMLHGAPHRVSIWAPEVETHQRPVLALHGFTGGGLDWAPLVPALQRHVVAPDFLGHGFSDAPHKPAPYSMARTLDYWLALLDQLELPQVDLLGYSMGGRVALSFAAAHPDRVGRLVLIGATPGLREPETRAARITQDAQRAEQLEAQGVPAFIKWWQSQPIIASQARIAAPIRAAMQARKHTARAWGWAASLRGLGTGSMPPVWAALPQLTVPTLLLTGGEDPKFTAIARAMRSTLPNALHAEIRGAGHCAHLEELPACSEVIRTFLDGEL